MTFLEQQAKKYRNNNFNNYNKKIQKFNEFYNHELSENECINLYKNYKQNCNFDRLIELSYLFENNNKIYNEIAKKIHDAINKDIFVEIYKNDLGTIYNKLFKISYVSKLSLIDKIEDSNIKIEELHKCITGRISYHNYCQKYTTNYKIDNHKGEILFSIYMFNRIKDIQTLLNNFKDKHILFKELLQEKAVKAINEFNEFENLSIDSTEMSAAYEKNIHKTRK